MAQSLSGPAAKRKLHVSVHKQIPALPLVRHLRETFQLVISKVHRVLVGKPEGKRPLGRPRRRWEDNIKMDLQEVGVGRGDWMDLAQDRDRWRALVGTVRDFRVP